MRTICFRRLLFAVLSLGLLFLSGCVVDMGTYGPNPSIESAVQTVLAKQGYYLGPIDGNVGPATSRAIRAYQRDHHLTPTGTINPALTASMGLTGTSQNLVGAPYFAGYPGYYPYRTYVPAYYAPPAVIGVGWGGGWPARYGGYGYRCWGNGGYGYRGAYGRGYYGRGWCR